MCKKCGGKKKILLSLSQNVVVRCTNCDSPLQGSNGVYYPVQSVFVTISKDQVDAWVKDGYTFTYMDA